MEDALSGLGDDFEWVVPDHPEGAVRHGPDSVIEFFREWIEPWDDLEIDWELAARPDPDAALATIDHARARARAAARRRDALLPALDASRDGPRRADGDVLRPRRGAPREPGSHDRTTRSYVRARLARRRSGCRVRGSARTPSSGLCRVIPTAPSATGRTPSPISSATGSTQWDEPDTDWKLEVTRPDTVLALVTTCGRGRASGVRGRDDLRAGLEVSRRRAGADGALSKSREGSARGRGRSVRVVAGEFKGRRLHAPRGCRHAAHRGPRARGALLDARRRVRSARARPLRRLGRARDRGAVAGCRSRRVFVERDRRALAALRRNLDAVGVDAEVRSQDALRFLARPEGGIRPRVLRPSI